MKKLILIVVLMPLMALAYNTWTDSKTGITWTYVDNGDGTLRLGGGSSTVTAVPKDTKGELVIPASIVGLSVSDIDDYAFYGCKGLESVAIPSSVTSIGAWAFRGCSGLMSVTIPSSVTGIAAAAFSGCSGLTSITLPFVGARRGNSGTEDSLFGYIFGSSSYSGAMVTEQYYSGSSRWIYYVPTALKSVIITDETKIGHGAFYNCSGLASVTIPPSVTSIGEAAFEGCRGLSEVNISDLSAWCGIDFASPSANPLCRAKKLVLNGNEIVDLAVPSGTESIGQYAFYNGVDIVSVKISDSVTSIGCAAFSGCSGLTSVTIPSSVTNIGRDAFRGCSGLSSVTIPESVISIGDDAFKDCSGLMSVAIPACVTRLANIFSNVYTKIKEIVLCDGVTNIGSYAFKDCSGLTSVTIPSSVTSIGWGAFSGCSGLTSVTIPSSVTSIGSYAFEDCSGLASVTIPEGVTNIGNYAFRGCGGLADASGLVIVKGVLYDYFGDSIAVIIPSGVMSIGGAAFEGCSGLEAITIPSSVTNIGPSAFCDCCGLTSVAIPPSVTSIVAGTFSGCSGLTSITLPFVGAQRDNSGTADALFGYIFGTSAYSGATATKQYYSSSASSTYYIPDALKSVIITDETKIGYGAFYNCSGLTSVTIPESVTDVEEKAFYGCSGLGDGVVDNDGWVLCVNGNVASAEIPDGVKQIVPGVFAGHTELTSVKLPPTLERISENDFSGCTGLDGVYITDLAAWCGVEFESAKANPLYYAKKLYLNEKELIYLDIPKGVEEIGQYAFYNCNRFMSVTIPPSVKSVGRDAFGGCSGLSAVNVSDLSAWCGINFASASANPLYCAKKLNLNGNEIVDLAVPSGTESIGQYAFYNGVDIASVTIPNSVTSIGTDAFKGCTGVKSATVPERFTLSSVFPGSYANIPTVTIPADATFIADGAFSGCSKITSIAIPSTVTSIGASAFRGCTQIAEIEIPEGVGELPGSLCEGCTGLTTVVIPNSVSNISSTAFKDCENIVSVTIPGRVAMKDVFPSSYSKIQDVTILDGEEVLLKEVFAECSALTTVVISEGVTTLGEDLFYGKTNLKELTLPSTVTSIGGYALYGCTSLEVIHVSNDGDIDAIKQMLYESGFDVESVRFDHVEEPVYVYYKVAFDAQGGVAERTETEVREGKVVGELPMVERDGYEFLGWFTAAVGGTQVMSATVVTKDVTFYAHWKRIGSTADEEIISGKKITIETGLKGYKASGLPKGLTYDAKTGKITGTATKVTALEGVVVKFTKSGAETEELTLAVRAEEASVGCEGLSNGPLPAGVVGASEGIDLQIYSEGGTKSVNVSKLPAGMKYDSKKGVITGAPSKAGNYEVALTVTTKYGTKETVRIPVSVAAMPVMAVGTFTGFVSVGEDNLGTFTLTTTDAGKLTAKVVTAAGTISFSGTYWDAVEDGVYRTTLTTKKGEKLTLTLDSTAAWDSNQLSGEFTTAAIAETKKTAAVSSRTYSVSAQRNAFGKTWYFAAVGDESTGWKLAYTEDTKGAALTVTLKADGSTSIAGKLPNGTDTKGKAVTIKVSASGYANVGGLKDGAILADFAPVLTVNKVKTVLAISTNLWLDRKNDHGTCVGEVRFVK